MAGASSEQEIHDMTVGDLPPANISITIVPYDPTWPEQYAREEVKIRAALDDRVVSMEHIGSTAVPGLPAKPILDIQLLVMDSGNEEDYAEALTTVGYTLRIREPEWEEHRVFKGTDPDVNLHVFSQGSLQARRHLAFRDRLRLNDTDRDRYAAVKLKLAAQTWGYVQNYADAKNDMIDEILAEAGITLQR